MRRKRRTKQELPPIICGIYFFEVVSGNPQKIGWKYIGQSEDIYERKDKHLSALKGKYHKNQKLKNYFNKYGENSLKHGILLECEEKDLKFWEIFFIACFNSYKKQGFNLTKGGDDKSFSFKKCKLQSMETGEIIEGESIKEFSIKCKVNPKVVSNVLLGKSKYAGEWFNPEMEWRPKTYNLKDPSNKIYSFCKINKFCDKYNLDYDSIFNVLSGKNIAHNGWTLPEPREKKENFCIEYSFISPNGEIYQGKNVNKFAKEHNLDSGSLREVLYGKHNHHLGWRKYNNGDKIEKFVFNEYKFINPNGELVIVNNMRKFAIENNLEETNLHKVFKKERNHHKGWRKYEDAIKLTRFEFKNIIYKFLSPKGKLYETKQIKSFAKLHELNRVCLSRLWSGKSKNHQGWTKYKEDSNG